MYPVLIVGVGGAGGKTVRALRETLMRKPRGADKIHRGYASPPRHM
jgi:cell division GTPase FtsZ